MPKISILLPSLHGGGAERMMVNLARGVLEQGYAVDLVLGKAEGPYLSSIPHGVRVIDLNSRRVLTSLPGLVSYLKKERPVALFSTLSHANVVAIWAKRLSREPVSVVVREPSISSAPTLYAKKMKVRLMPMLIRHFYRLADGIVAVSQGVAQDLSEVTGIPLEDISVIYNPVVSEDLISKANEVVDHSWLVSGEVPVILAVGRLSKEKDFVTLIKAFKQVRKNINARLLILGEGPERKCLENTVRELGLDEDVQLPGFVNNPYAFMAKANLFVLSSLYEGLPNALIEAMACGAPVVSTDCLSGPAEILDNGKYGPLVPVGDAERLAEAIYETILHPMGKELLMSRGADFSIKNSTLQYLKLVNLE